MRSLRSFVWTVAVCAILLAAAPLGAQAPPALVNYQGRLTDAEGTAMVGPQALEFRVYSAATGGTLVWGPQTFSAVPLVDGYFNVLLGSEDSAAGGSSITTAFTGTGTDARYFSVSVGGVEQLPRQQVVSVPWALNIPDSSVTSAKIADDSVVSSKIPLEAIQASDLGPSIVSSAKIQDQSVLPEDLGDSSYASTQVLSTTVISGDRVWNNSSDSIPKEIGRLTLSLSGSVRPVYFGVREEFRTGFTSPPNLRKGVFSGATGDLKYYAVLTANFGPQGVQTYRKEIHKFPVIDGQSLPFPIFDFVIVPPAGASTVTLIMEGYGSSALRISDECSLVGYQY